MAGFLFLRTMSTTRHYWPRRRISSCWLVGSYHRPLLIAELAIPQVVLGLMGRGELGMKISAGAMLSNVLGGAGVSS